MKILFVGDLNEYGRSFQRYRAILSLGHKVTPFSATPVPQRPGIDKTPFLERLMWKLKFPLDVTSVNKKIKEASKKGKFDIFWIEKGVTVRPGTLKFLKKNFPEIPLMSLSEDDMFAFHNRTFYYKWGLSFYDFVFTTKVYNLEELKLLGAKKTVLFLDAYDEGLHRPVSLSREDEKRLSADVGFVGTFESDRAQKMLFLARNGIRVVVWGNGWESWAGKHDNLVIKNQPLYGEDYIKAINATKINLCFLRKMNRDEVTSRSVEIPACGGFMLAERTKRHEDFFKDGEEAVFFGTEEDMLQKAKYYLKNDAERNEIAAKGRARCLKSGYSHRDQIVKIISFVSGSENLNLSI